MSVDYNNFSKTFAQSRRNMKWEELEYFFGILKKEENILDLGCGSGRLLEAYREYFGEYPKRYTGVDVSHGLLEEAKKDFPEEMFMRGDMEDIEKIAAGKKFENIFLIASFHHLDSLEKREEVLFQLKNILTDTGKIYMTNWALDSDMNREKYKKSKIAQSENEFGSKDFNIAFGKFERYYHCFSLEELEHLSRITALQIEENRLFDTEKNIITILKK